MKGIILAGGRGSRLAPLTYSASKQLLGVYDKPMIYYPIYTLMEAGIRDILIISTPDDSKNFKRLLRSGAQWGVHFEYAEQRQPRGLAEAFIIGKDFINNEPSCLILGDNIFYGTSVPYACKTASERVIVYGGAAIFCYKVKDPKRYGVVEIENGYVISIEEKPQHPKSNFAIPGMYFYDNKVCDYAANLKPSARGELEITDINRIYLEDRRLVAYSLPDGTAWLDVGTQESLLQAAEFVAAIQNRQGVMIACPEEVAFKNGYIGKRQLKDIAETYNKDNEYGAYLWKLLAE